MVTFFDMYGGVDPAQIQTDYAHALAPGETVEYACKTVRIFSSSRTGVSSMLIRKGLRGIESATTAFPSTKFLDFRLSTGGALAGLVTIRLWSSSNEVVEVSFDRSANGEGIQKTLASKIC